jgi:hypothetical protein
VAKLCLGEVLYDAKIKSAIVSTPAPARVVPRAVRSAPGAPRTATSALPQTNAGDAIAAKMANGTASLAEVQEYTRGKMAA